VVYSPFRVLCFPPTQKNVVAWNKYWMIVLKYYQHFLLKTVGSAYIHFAFFSLRYFCYHIKWQNLKKQKKHSPSPPNRNPHPLCTEMKFMQKKGAYNYIQWFIVGKFFLWGGGGDYNYTGNSNIWIKLIKSTLHTIVNQN
jgi:hypothetical protein